MKKCYIVMENGRVFEGVRFGADAPALGEMVFTTGVCGYLETLTDPCYHGQIVMQTFPLNGNYGIIEEDLKNDAHVAGYVVRSWCETPSNFRCQYDMDEYLKRQGVVGVYGVDTREITRMLRMEGVMNAAIVDEVPQDLSFIRNYRIEKAVEAVCGGKTEEYPAQGEEKYQVAVLDFGDKGNIVDEITKRGCRVCVLPHNTAAEAILSGGYDGVVISNGPGDPREHGEAAAEIKKLLGKVAIYGVGLGHQLLAMANEGEVVKLKFGHRGGNQPVRFLDAGRTYITSQNHGYAVNMDKLPRDGQAVYVNANDGTCEGIFYPALKAFSTQFVPEISAGPQDNSFLYDRFVQQMGGNDICL